MNTRAESSGAVGRAFAKSGSDAPFFFAGFTFSGSQGLMALARFYGLTAPTLEPSITLGEYLARSCYASPRAGYRITFGNAELIILEVEEGVITKVGLRLLPSASRQRRKGWSFGTRNHLVGASLARSGHGLTGVASR